MVICWKLEIPTLKKRGSKLLASKSEIEEEYKRIRDEVSSNHEKIYSLNEFRNKATSTVAATKSKVKQSERLIETENKKIRNLSDIMDNIDPQRVKIEADLHHNEAQVNLLYDVLNSNKEESENIEKRKNELMEESDKIAQGVDKTKEEMKYTSYDIRNIRLGLQKRNDDLKGLKNKRGDDDEIQDIKYDINVLTSSYNDLVSKMSSSENTLKLLSSEHKKTLESIRGMHEEAYKEI